LVSILTQRDIYSRKPFEPRWTQIDRVDTAASAAYRRKKFWSDPLERTEGAEICTGNGGAGCRAFNAIGEAAPLAFLAPHKESKLAHRSLSPCRSALVLRDHRPGRVSPWK